MNKEQSSKDVKSLDAAVHECVYVDWYKFKMCTIKTCKNHSLAVPSRCLAVDRVAPSSNKVISDAELNLYKFAEDGISTRLVSIKRKKAIDRLRNILILDEYIEFIKRNFAESRKINPKLPQRMISRLEARFPLKVKRLDYQRWMLKHVFDDLLFKEFLENRVRGDKTEFKLHEILGLTQMKFDVVVKALSNQQTKE